MFNWSAEIEHYSIPTTYIIICILILLLVACVFMFRHKRNAKNRKRLGKKIRRELRILPEDELSFLLCLQEEKEEKLDLSDDNVLNGFQKRKICGRTIEWTQKKVFDVCRNLEEKHCIKYDRQGSRTVTFSHQEVRNYIQRKHDITMSREANWIRRFSKPLQNVREIQRISDREQSFLLRLLFMDQNKLDLRDEKAVERFRSIKLNGKTVEWTQTDISDIYQGLEKRNCLQHDTKGSTIFFFSEEIKEHIFRTYMYSYDNGYFLEFAFIDLIKNYCRSDGYQCRISEKCYKLPSHYNQKLVDRLKLEILIHETVRDKDIHRIISMTLGIPQEILTKNYEYRSNYLESLKEDASPVYRPRAIFIGHAGAGKTTLLKRLKNSSIKDIMEKTFPTKGLEVHDDVFEVKETDLDGDGDSGSDGSFNYQLVPLLTEMEGESSVRIFNMTDFGGQNAYYACHQIHMSRRAIYILVLDISKKLSQRIDEKLCDHKGSIYWNSTYGGNFVFWVKSVHTHCEDDTPIIVVGTHSERMSRAKIDSYYESLEKILPDLLKRHISKGRFFTVKLAKREKELDSVEDIEQCLVRLAKDQTLWGEKIPRTWLDFEKCVRKKRNSIKVLQISDWDQLETDNSINYDMLQFYHDIGIILYFNEPVLENIIILDIQWFVDTFKYIITDKNHVHPDIKKYEYWQTFYKTGELSSECLAMIWNVQNCHPLPEYEDIVLLYMERLCLLAKTSTDPETYYIPSMNKKDFGIEQKRLIKESTHKTSVLLLKFDFLPQFTFYQLVVSCISKGWKFLGEDDKKTLYKNAAMFAAQNHEVVILVTDRFIQLQVFVRGPSMTVDKNVSRKIRNTTISCLDSIIKTFRKKLPYTIGYSCRASEIGEDNTITFIAETALKTWEKIMCPLHIQSSTQHEIDCKEFLKYWKEETDDTVVDRSAESVV